VPGVGEQRQRTGGHAVPGLGGHIGDVERDADRESPPIIPWRVPMRVRVRMAGFIVGQGVVLS
jgi:hypothetical protein